MIAPLLEIFPELIEEVGNFTAFDAEVVVGFGVDRCLAKHGGYDSDGLRIFAICRRYSDGRPIRVRLDGHWLTTAPAVRRTLGHAWQAILVGDLWQPYEEDPSMEGFWVGEIRREDEEAQSALRVAEILGSQVTSLMSSVDLARFDA